MVRPKMVQLHQSCKTAERVSVGHCEMVSLSYGRDDGAALQVLAAVGRLRIPGIALPTIPKATYRLMRWERGL